jgi:Holliday junction resolvase
LKSIDIEPEVKNELVKRGFRSVRSSNSRRVVLDFEQTKKAVSIFSAIYGKPIMRVLIHLLYEEMPLTLDEANQILSRTDPLKESLSESPDKNIFCTSCGAIIYTYNTYEEKKPRRKMKCPNCYVENVLNECPEKDNWILPRQIIKHYLDQLSSCHFCFSRPIGVCFNCMDGRARAEIELAPLKKVTSLSKVDLRKNLSQLFCRRCGRLYDITEAYFIDEDARRIWQSNGIWLEWYVKNILKNHLRDAHLEQGLILVNNERSVDVDVILARDGKIVSFECKAKKPGKKASFEEVSDVLKLLAFSDQVFLVTTGRVTENDRKHLLSIGGSKLSIVESPDLEGISVEGAN